ncbi:MAG: DUF2341 domain-containing protein, partial [Candidatus Aureabacteria bacterium]|nr:DUF2341 domain-containing protein [Candidatus Auribacterota bacterium]
MAPATSVANYQVKVTLISGTNFDYTKLSFPATGADLRFAGSDGSTLQDYWIESWNNGGSSTLWVKVAASGTSTIYMYYGNPSASSTSSGTNTFEFFDDFNDASLDTNKWQTYLAGGGNATESGGYLNITVPSGNAKQAKVYSKSAYGTDTSVEFNASFNNTSNANFAYYGYVGGNGGTDAPAQLGAFGYTTPSAFNGITSQIRNTQSSIVITYQSGY